ncbi:hypothetical protein P7M32_06530 [Bisgaard Taxon 10/6]|uniref:Uncharacterized protein n=1 Tax=Exercitatus varius TaxID=67857 RepID=A0ABT6EU11_9PAST|nr:hypothetical protein [Exercitatus varius]MDG2938715.1 hypothetical protein [Exercitatus varius]MDG2946083.1 hypothetical protein [Exercitatus varius]MDG2955395.1 hypothetical protein [Exercitatus varius]MDG2962784.1 hypothetical protein [Exercitatus varius]MDG2963676.1 hypothetical protein [Exercitatus varius]
MTQLTTQKSNMVVTALSNIDIPSNILEQVNISELVREIHQSQQDVVSSKDALVNAREEKEKGSFWENWWYNRDDAIKQANENLSMAVGDLSSNSSKLMVVNTAISKVLLEQQSQLEQQQMRLSEQAYKIEKQNYEIAEQQAKLDLANQELAEQQIKINEANKGLMEAKGITQEQALKLVNIVKRTEALEDDFNAKISIFQENFENNVNEINNSNVKLHEKLNNTVKEIEKSLISYIDNKNDKITFELLPNIIQDITSINNQLENIKKSKKIIYDLVAKNSKRYKMFSWLLLILFMMVIILSGISYCLVKGIAVNF